MLSTFEEYRNCLETATKKVENDKTGRSFILHTDRNEHSDNYHNYISNLVKENKYFEKDDSIFKSNNFVSSELHFEYQNINCEFYKFYFVIGLTHHRNSFIYFSDFVDNKEDFVKKFDKNVKKYNSTNNINGIKLFINKSENNGFYWSNKEKYIKTRSFDLIFQDKTIMAELKNDLDTFDDMKEICSQMNTNFKRTYLLHSPPGMGKTSIITAIATYTNRAVYKLIISVKGFDDQALVNLVSDLPENSLLAIEDVDTLFSVHREGNTGVTFSTFINALDGLQSNNDIIVVMTTNHKDRLDPSLLRSKRVDKIFDLSVIRVHMVTDMMKKWLPYIKPEEIDSIGKDIHATIVSKKLSMASLQSVLEYIRINKIADAEKIKSTFDERIVYEISGITQTSYTN